MQDKSYLPLRKWPFNWKAVNYVTLSDRYCLLFLAVDDLMKLSIQFLEDFVLYRGKNIHVSCSLFEIAALEIL